MSDTERGDRPLAVKAGGAVAPPYAFEEFARRSARRQATRSTVAWSVAASVASFGLVLTLALVTGREGAHVMSADVHSPAVLAEIPTAQVNADAQPVEEPALVDLGQFAVTSDLEENIAWFDAALSESRVQSASPEHVKQLESARNQLAESLQKVSYAHSFLGL
jgi:hypothetical protein